MSRLSSATVAFITIGKRTDEKDEFHHKFGSGSVILDGTDINVDFGVMMRM